MRCPSRRVLSGLPRRLDDSVTPWHWNSVDVFTLNQEFFDLFRSEFRVKFELEGIVYSSGHSWCADRDGYVLTSSGLDFLNELPISAVVLLGTFGKSHYLRTDNGSSKVAHTKREVRKGLWGTLEVLWWRNSDMLWVEALVGTSVNSGLGSNCGIISEQESTLARVDQLERLRGDSRCDTNVAGVLGLPADYERASAVLKQDGAIVGACNLDESLDVARATQRCA